MSEKLKLLLESAIKEEEYAYQLYTAAMGKTSTDSVRKALKELAEQEKMHKEKLETLDAGKLGKFVTPDRIEKIDIADELLLTPIDEFNDLKQVFQFAIKKEIETREMYQDMANSVGDDNVKKLLNTLASEEARHEAMLRDLLKQIEI